MRSLVGPVLLHMCWLAYLASAQVNENTAMAKQCQAQETCGACIAESQHCAWCTQDGFDKNNQARCDLYTSLVSKGCDPSYIMNPDNDVKYTKNNKLQDSDSFDQAVQIKPQRVTLKIRPNKPASFKVTFRQAENYPVDLYYLMDLSNSMADDKDNLARLGVLIARNMSAITKDFQLGFGSFVDKVTMPYVSTIKSKLLKPCKECAAPYGFKHNLALNKSPNIFQSNVMAAPISGNLDSPEGGFDAMIQAIVCKEIGWRNPSRKMLLFSTDAGFHFAGDGKLGGIVKPNDGKCHLDSDGYYTESTNQDYPSISQLAAKISEENVNVIFAVTEGQFPTYKRLSKYIEGSVAGVLANDSSNIVDLVQKNYNLITSKVKLLTENAEGITVTIKSKCKNPNGDLKETSVCEDLKIGESVEFDVSVEVKECPADEKVRTFTISPVGLTEKLTVKLDLICQCECQKSGIPNSPFCNGTGTYECGSCACPEGRYGKYCECDGSEVSSEQSDARCIRKNTTSICMGRGECVCGECKCFARTPKSDNKFSGKFCECDDYSCYSVDGKKLCGGPEQGVCKCGKCLCQPGFTGDACDCPLSNATCIAPSSGLYCNGNGECACGKCRCKAKYRGPTCEECPTCLGRCADNRDCVQCKAFQTGPKTKEECDAQCQNIEMVDEAKVEHPNMTRCQFKDEDDCTFYFTYEYKSSTELIIKAQRTKVCPEGVNVLAIVLGVIGGIVAVGLALLLIWKLLTMIHDRREFAKFEKERKNAKWDTGENPIYKQATSTFKNPTYAGKN
ncbi:integrin beta-1-like [Liolophura sinensis]|uniref:integrin beta-1-like n=1 Tax=Liolophura sinensis TaxID=3198878 RepID=UPI0031583B29